MEKEYIYIITNTENGKKYVGKSYMPSRRFLTHMSNLRRGAHTSSTFQTDFNEYGEGAFIFEIVDRCESNDSVDREVEWMRKYKSFLSEYGYNDSDKTANPLLTEMGLPIRSGVPRGVPSKQRGMQRYILPSDVSYDSVDTKDAQFYKEYLSGKNTSAIAKEHKTDTGIVSKGIKNVLDANGYEFVDNCRYAIKKSDTLLHDYIRWEALQIKLRDEEHAKRRKAERKVKILERILEENGISYLDELRGM